MRSAESDCDVLLVEGAGGLLVPITESLSFDALFARWSLDLVIVAANRLGVINHVRLTIAAARQAELSVRTVVLNHPTPDATDPSVADNARLIAELEDVRVICRRMRADLWDAVTAGKLSLPIDRRFPLDEAVAAQAHMRENKHFGKIVLTM